MRPESPRSDSYRSAGVEGFRAGQRPEEARSMTDSGATWTEERVEILKKLWSEGLSASQIAAEIGSVTRNAVIGKVHRLGLSGRGKAKSASPQRAKKSPRTPSAPIAIPQPVNRNPWGSERDTDADRSGAVSRDGRCRGSDFGARDHHGPEGVDVSVAHGRPDEAGVSLLRGARARGPALLQPSLPASRTNRSRTASGTAASHGPEAPRRAASSEAPIGPSRR